MARIEASAEIFAPLEQVYAVAKNVEAFPQFMPDLQSVKVLERRNNETLTEWIGTVQGRKIRWVEEDVWDDSRHACQFRQREGDFTKYEGTWSFTSTGPGTRTILTVEFELDLPLAGPLVSNLLKVLVRKNLEGMLAGLKQQLEQATSRLGRA